MVTNENEVYLADRDSRCQAYEIRPLDRAQLCSLRFPDPRPHHGPRLNTNERQFNEHNEIEGALTSPESI